MTRSTLTHARRRGQGMTEYIIIVGLIGILLVVAVGNFRTQLDVTIQGSDGHGGAAGGVEKADIGRAGGGGGSTGGSSSGVRTTTAGYTVEGGKYTSGPNTGDTWDPAIDPAR